MVDVSLIPEAAWCEARRPAEVIRPLMESAHRSRHLCSGRRCYTRAIRAADLFDPAALPREPTGHTPNRWGEASWASQSEGSASRRTGGSSCMTPRKSACADTRVTDAHGRCSRLWQFTELDFGK